MIFSRVPLGSLFCQVEVSSLGPSSGTAPSVNSVNSVRNSFGNASASQTLQCLCWFFAMFWSPFAVFWRDLKIFEFSAPILQSRQSHFTLFVGCTPRCYWGRAQHGNGEQLMARGAGVVGIAGVASIGPAWWRDPPCSIGLEAIIKLTSADLVFGKWDKRGRNSISCRSCFCKMSRNKQRWLSFFPSEQRSCTWDILRHPESWDNALWNLDPHGNIWQWIKANGCSLAA